MKVHIPVDVVYGSLSLFTSFLNNIFLLYHVDMFVSVYKIDKTSFWIGELIFLLWNSLNDPVFGWISDSKYLTVLSGKEYSATNVIQQRLNALQWAGPLFTLAFISFWIHWSFPGLQFVICLCLYDGLLTMVDLHHSALMADMSVSADMRRKLNGRSSLFSIIGSASVFISYAVWNKDKLRNFRIFCVLLAFLSFIGFVVVVRKLKGMYKHSPQIEDTKSSHEDIGSHKKLAIFVKQLNKQTNFKWFAVMNLVQVFHCHFNSNFFPLFLENLLGDAISPGFGSFLIGMSFVAPHFNNLYFLSLCKRYGVYSVIRILFVVKLILSCLMFFAGPNNIWLLCFFIASNRVFTEGTCKLLNLVISDLVDEDCVMHQRRQAVSALMFGTAALLSKPGQTLAPLIGTWMLNKQTGHDIFQTGSEYGSIKSTGSRSDLDAQAEYRLGCFNLLVYVPIICAIVQLLVWTQFTLHGRRLETIKSIRQDASNVYV